MGIVKTRKSSVQRDMRMHASGHVMMKSSKTRTGLLVVNVENDCADGYGDFGDILKELRNKLL